MSRAVKPRTRRKNGAGAPVASAKRWFLYLIECRDGNIYTGIAVDVAARYAAHVNGKGARYTRSHPPKRLLAAIDYPDRSSALSAEYAVKQITSAEKRAYALLLALGEAGVE